MSTIKDIAREAGVSIATVSIVLNGKGGARKISTETQARIHAIAQKLHYVPNQSAKKLRAAGQGHYAIAFYWATDFRIHYLARITLGIQQEIMRQHNVVHLAVVPYEADHLQEQMESLQNEFFNSIIIANTSDKDMDYLQHCRLTYPVVLFNRESPYYSSVTMDNYKLGCRVARHFLRKKVYNAAILTHNADLPIMSQWTHGFLNTFCQNGHPLAADHILRCSPHAGDAVALIRRLHAAQALPRAIFCESDLLAHGVLYACHNLQIAIPQQLEVFTMGINSPAVNDYAVPSLSRIDIPMGEIGAACLRLAVDLLEKRRPNPTVLYVDGTKIIRQSSPE
ncbi:transcriptional regulator, LacI family [Megasphaera lornae]|uniref:Transcriptional regulator, LacI family n=1 Tax=Megasphaera lornae TaxID=1000568 RepID=A0ABN0D016_9FIRM|nr:LacI family DNA-binding transcriptional regulator [Megasphaera lornae]EGL40673.1 transcriptional regulator, LacI family [Megasphaera lornae]